MTTVPPSQGATSVSATPGDPGPGGGKDRSLGDIVSDVTADLSKLMRQELELAKTELKEEATKAASGAAMLGGAGLAGYFVLLFLSVAGLYGLAEAMNPWLAALIVTAVWLVIAAVLALVGRKKLKEANPALPTTQQTLKEDVQWAKQQTN